MRTDSKISTLIIIGVQWGDEGKGKIIDVLAQDFDFIVRYQGGNNAGHTIIFNGEEVIFHLIPSGILHLGTVGIIGSGVAFNPKAFLTEVQDLNKKGVDVQGKILISENAHVIMPYHLYLDEVEDKKAGIGTTVRGIGPTYRDKIGRVGIRVIDLFDAEILKEKLHKNCAIHPLFLKDSRFNPEVIQKEYMDYGKTIEAYVTDTSIVLNRAIDDNKRCLFEGAQGTLLDIDYGTYPFVTASNTIAGGACTGTGIGPTKIDKVLGVAKAYTTRVGNGPFPTEIHGTIGKHLQIKGDEYGATTGRPRRCGWFDSVSVKYSVRINGLGGLIITKLDILSGFEYIYICTGYKYNEKIIDEFPLSSKVIMGCEPIYEKLRGWQMDISLITSYDDLPEETKIYIRRIEELIGVKVTMLSVGCQRHQNIILDTDLIQKKK